MKSYLLALPVAALMCGAAFAQTSDTATGSTYGTTWSETTGSMFYSDPEMTTMRTPEEISTGWSTMSQEDRDSVLAECARYRTDSGTTAAAGTGTADAGAAATTGTAETTTGADATTTTESTTTGDATASMGVSAENMKMLCDTVEAY